MKTKRFRLLTVFLTVVMMLALSLNVMAAKSNAVTQDGLTVQLFTDKDSYKTGESVKASVQVDNHSGKEVFIFTEIKTPGGLKLASESAAFDALLKDGESWITPGGVLLNATGAATAGSSTATGDNMQAGFWVILTTLAVGGMIALFVYGKNKATWLSIMLCIAMVGGMVVAAVPTQAADINGDIVLSCAIQMDGKETEVTAIVSYVIYDEAEQAADEPTATPEATAEPVTAVNTIYVSASAVVGEGDGSIDNPFANIQEAQARVREMKEADLYPENGITVYFRGGVYSIDETITFTEEDSGEEDAPVVYCAYQDEEVTFVGGRDIELSDFTAVTDTEILSRLADGMEDKIKQIDLGALGITDLGELNMYGHSRGYFLTAGIDIPVDPPLEVFFEGESMDIARYPNEGWVYIESVIETGDVIQNWTSGAVDGNIVPEEERHYPPYGSKFTVNDETATRMQNWTKANDIWVYGYWKETWSDQSMPVEYIEAASGTVKTQYPSGKEITAGQWFYFYNLLEEVDVPGEYYIDRDTKMMYFYAPAESGTVTLSLVPDHMISLGKGTHDIEFQGIEFKAGRKSGFSMGTVSDIKITECDITKFAEYAMTMTDCKNVVVSGCHLYDLGTGGVYTSYNSDSTVGSEMIKNLTPMGIVVENCEINNFSRIRQTYSPAVKTSGVGMVVRNCKIHDSTHLAIEMDGNDTLIENNEIYDVLQTSSDASVIYGVVERQQMGTVIRNNYIHDISSSAGKHGVHVIYMDDTKDNVIVEFNLIVNIAGSGVKINGGWDNIVRNNVFVNVDEETVIINPMGLTNGEKYDINSEKYFGLLWDAVENPVYTSKYPHLIGLNADGTEGGSLSKVEYLKQGKEFNVPKHNQVYDNVIINVDKDIYLNSSADGQTWTEEKAKQYNKVESSVVCSLEESGFADIINGAYTYDMKKNSVTLNNGDFTLSNTSKIYTLIPEFKAYDFSKIGKDNQCEKAGSLGKLNYEESDILFFEDFAESDALSEWTIVWNKCSSVQEGNYTKVNSTEQLEVGLSKVNTEGTTGNIDIKETFTSYDGKMSYEMDFIVEDFGDDQNADVAAMIARSGNNSIVNVGIAYKNDGFYFKAYDGGNGSKESNNWTTIECKEGVLYHVKLVVDPYKDTYDLYIDDTLGIDDGLLRKDVSYFNGIFIPVKRTYSGETLIVCYDNILVQKLGKEVIQATGITINEGDALSVVKEDTVSLTATVTPDDATEKTVTWTSSDETKATVDANGMVTGVSEGSVTITAAVGTVTDTITITVTNEAIAVTEVILDKTSLEIGTDSVATLAATIKPYDATNKAITWTSSDPNVVTVDANGKLAAVAVGTATITAADGGVTATCQVTVDSNIILFQDWTDGLTGWEKMNVHNDCNCSASVTDTKELEIISCNNGNAAPSVRKIYQTWTDKISIEYDMRVTWPTGCNHMGTSMLVKAKVGSNAKTTVANIAGSFKSENDYRFKGYFSAVSPAEVYGNTFENDHTYSIKLIVDPNEKICDVYVDGTAWITGKTLNSGIENLTGIELAVAKCECPEPFKAYFDNITIRKIEDTTIAVENVTINNGTENVDVTVEDTIALTAVVTPDNATDKTVIWSSENTAIATVNETTGVVTGVAVGSTTITATAGDAVDTITVSVIAASIAVTEIRLDKTELEIGVGSVATLTATIEPENATDKTVTWTSDNTAVATVDETTGVVTGVAAGTVNITATSSNGKTATCAVTVDSNIILFEDWTNTNIGTVFNAGTSCTCGAAVKAGELEIVSCSTHGPSIRKNITIAAGTDKISIEYDMKVTYPTNCTDVSAAMIVKGTFEGNSNTTATLVSFTGKYDATNGYHFAGYSNKAPSNTILKDEEGAVLSFASGSTYKIKLIIDPTSKKWDVYVNDNCIISGKSLPDTAITSFTRLELVLNNCSCSETSKVSFDNIIIRKVVETTE